MKAAATRGRARRDPSSSARARPPSTRRTSASTPAARTGAGDTVATGTVARLRRRQRSLALAWTLVLVAGTGAGVLSLAIFTNQEPVPEPFTVGTLVLGAEPVSTVLTYSGMIPGDSIEGTVTVRNDGTGDLRYAMASSATDPDGKNLGDVLQLDIERRTGCGGPLLEAVASGPASSVTFGDPAAGSQTGDRSLASGVDEVLCIRATLPTGTDGSVENAATTVTITLVAEQVAGNP